MMVHTSFYTLVLMILVSILTVMHADQFEDPCPGKLNHTDMCSDDFVIEDSHDGSKAVDSVLLRITKQLDNCTCYVSLQNTETNYTIYMSKYNELSSSAPKQQNCGLAVDVDYVDKSNTIQSIESINCASGTSMRPIVLNGNELKFKSRIIEGKFTTGYCMQIYRDQAILSCKMIDQGKKAGSDNDWIRTNGSQHTSIDECKRYCLQTDICVAVHYEYEHTYCFVYIKTTISLTTKDKSFYSRKDCVDTQKLKIKCYPPDSTTQTSQVTSTDVTISTKTDTVTTPITDSTMTSFDTQSYITKKDDFNKDKNSDLYVYIGAGAGGLLMILFIICIIVCIRKHSNQTSEKESKNYATKHVCREDRDSDNDYGGLKDNVLYISSEPEPNEILEDGNYNTVDLEQTRIVNQDISLDGNYSTVDGICKSKPVIKPKPNSSSKRGSDEETIHLSTMDNSNNEYAVVDKGRHSDDVKHINPEQRNDTEYAVVNKVNRSRNNN